MFWGVCPRPSAESPLGNAPFLFLKEVFAQNCYLCLCAIYFLSPLPPLIPTVIFALPFFPHFCPLAFQEAPSTSHLLRAGGFLL